MSGPVFFCSISSLSRAAAPAPSVPSLRTHARTHRHVRAHAVTATFSSSGIFGRWHARSRIDVRARPCQHTSRKVGVVVSTSALSTPGQTNLASQRLPNPTFVSVLFKTISGARSDKLAVCIGESTRLNISQGPPRPQTTSGGRRLMVGWATSPLPAHGPSTWKLPNVCSS